MDNDLIFSPQKLQIAQTVQSLEKCRNITEQFGLILTGQQMQDIAAARFDSLHDNGRVEFGEGIAPRLILAFCDSPYVTQQNFADTITELQDIFYYYKGEAGERLSDDELIEYMKSVFNGKAQGSLDYLAGTSLSELCRNARNVGIHMGDEDDRL